MKFRAMVAGLNAKDTSDGVRIEIKLVTQFDSALFAEMGTVFSSMTHVQINEEQGSLGFDKDPEQIEVILRGHPREEPGPFDAL